MYVYEKDKKIIILTDVFHPMRDFSNANVIIWLDKVPHTMKHIG